MPTLRNAIQPLVEPVERKMSQPGDWSDTITFDLSQLSDFQYDPSTSLDLLQKQLYRALQKPLIDAFPEIPFKYQITVRSDSPFADLKLVYTGRSSH